MHAMESSDRRLNWESLGETVEAEPPYRVIADRAIGPAYLLEETAISMQMTGVRASGLSLLACVFEGGRWIDVRFDTSELTHVTFRHVYFQGVDFGGANLRHVRFEHCVFSECAPPEGESVERIGCFFREVAAPVTPTPAVPASLAVMPAKAVSDTAVAKPAPAAPPDRFDGLER